MRGICIYEISPAPLGTPQGKSAFNVVVTIGHRTNKQGRRVPHLKTKRVYGTKADAEAEGIALRHTVNTKTYELHVLGIGERIRRWKTEDKLRGSAAVASASRVNPSATTPEPFPRGAR